MVLFHATYRARLANIKKLGLGAKQIKNWSISEDGVTYFAPDAEVAFSFAETAEDISDSVYESGIIVLAVEAEKLDIRRFKIDGNVRDDELVTYIYKGTIDPRLIGVYTRDKGFVGMLTSLKRVPSYE